MNNSISILKSTSFIQTFFRLITAVVLLYIANMLAGCGAATGIPGHGGGKRFAVEQELVAAATRAAIKQIDLSSLKDKRINLYVNAIGDTGAGNLTGGRFSIVSQLRGDYTQTAPVTERSLYGRYTAKTTSSTTSDDSTSDTTQTTQTLNQYPYYTKTTQEGTGVTGELGVQYEGLGAYHNSEEITSNDLQYLSALMQTYFFLQGVSIVPPSEAKIDVYVTIDVFGTVYTRVDWFLANNEILRAKTSLEVLAVDHYSGELLMGPQTASSESTYNEQYILWAGPVLIRKSLKKGTPLLSDYTNMDKASQTPQPVYKIEHAPYPFQDEIEH